jgi:hypothetical protein
MVWYDMIYVMIWYDMWYHNIPALTKAGWTERFELSVTTVQEPSRRSIRLAMPYWATIIRTMMVAVSTFETSVIFYETTRRSVPDDCHLHTHRRENLISHSTLLCYEAVLHTVPSRCWQLCGSWSRRFVRLVCQLTPLFPLLTLC